MNRERALRLQQRGLAAWIAMLGSSSEGARVLRRGGVTAAIVPATPQRSICNSVAYTDAAELGEMLDELDRAYLDAGIAAWTVWAPEFDAEAIEALEAAGHMLDGSPRAMSARIAELSVPEPGDLDWSVNADGDPADLGRLNDLAYGLPAESGMAPALASMPPDPGRRLYRAKVGGEVACVLVTLDHHGQAPQRKPPPATPPGDLGFYFVATHPDHRGVGLASRLIGVAIAQGRERGIETSSLQGSPMGQPIYRRLGFGDDYGQTMWERRR